jgi:hypothetical protein
MKKTLLALSVILALAGSASAQFTFTGFTGKTMKNSAQPYVRILGKSVTGKTVTELEHYFIWEKDHVKIQSVMFDAGKPNMVRENLFYYADFDAQSTKVARSEATKAIEAILSSKSGASVPTWENTEVYYSEAMRDLASLTFQTIPQGQSFLKKMGEKQRSAGSLKKRITLKSVMREKQN